MRDPLEVVRRLQVDSSGWFFHLPDTADVILDHTDQGGPVLILKLDREPEARRQAGRRLIQVAGQVIHRLSGGV